MPSQILCGCYPLCDRCLEQRIMWLGGVAQARGEAWARRTARSVSVDHPWPETARMRDLARLQISDIAKDERLCDALVKDVVIGARRWWEREREQ